MEWTDTALVLHVGRFRENDLWLRLLTRHHGMISAFAFGGSRSRKRFSGCLDVLNVIHIRAKLTRNGTYISLEEARLLEGPRRLRHDWHRLGMLMNCIRFLEAQGVAPDTAQSAFALTHAVLRLGEEAEVIREAIPVLFRFRVAADQGYVPDFSHCGHCGCAVRDLSAGQVLWFAMEDGTLVCTHCHTAQADNSRCIPVPLPVGQALQSVQQNDPPLWNGLVLDAYEWRTCVRLADEFVQFHLGLVWESGRFRRR
jgi:DNA repair protein RecO (recombination protein O)